MVTHQLQVERRTGKVRQSETDVLPLCHATNRVYDTIYDTSALTCAAESEQLFQIDFANVPVVYPPTSGLEAVEKSG